MKAISAADANRHFSSVLRIVAAGEEVTVLSRGKPVAKISPIRSDQPARQSAKQTLLARLREQAPTGTRDWARSDLYEG